MMRPLLTEQAAVPTADQGYTRTSSSRAVCPSLSVAYLPIGSKHAVQFEVHRVQMRKLPFEQLVAGERLVLVVRRLQGHVDGWKDIVRRAL